jgi:AraC-like DNA-binding protein
VEKKVLIGDSPWLVIPALLASCFLFIIGWLGNHQKSVIVDKTPNKKILEKIENEISVNDEHFNNIRNKIDNLFITEKIYLNAELNLWEVSRLAGTNRTYISIVINHYYNQNFSTFVNNFRVKHVVELIKKNPELTNIDLATLSGFGSVISMQRAIQSFEGKTIREIKTEL